MFPGVQLPPHLEARYNIAPTAEREEWRTGRPLSRDRLRAILVPFLDGRLEATPVSKLVNRARNEGPELLEPPPPETEEQLELLA